MKYVKRDLIRRLNKEFDLDIPENATVDHFHPGWNDRSAGAWAWAFNFNNPNSIGSQFKMTELLNAEKLSIYTFLGDTEIIKED
jgi:hypothetical protein